MINKFTSHHWSTADGMPMGGVSNGVGFTISWQNGPLGTGESRIEPNGAFVETVLAAVHDRIAYYQAGRFASEYNAVAMQHIQSALASLDARTKNREARKVEGTHSV